MTDQCRQNEARDGRALAIAELLRSGHAPAKVAEAVRIATEERDPAKAMAALYPRPVGASPDRTPSWGPNEA